MSNKFYNRKRCLVGKYKGAGPVYNKFNVQCDSVSFKTTTKKDPKYSKCNNTYSFEVIDNQIFYYVDCDYVE